jgi:hypothetical protein
MPAAGVRMAVSHRQRFNHVMDRLRDPLPPEPGTVPTAVDPDPAPERDELPAITDPRDRGGTGQPVGADNIREGRVDGVMAPQGSTQGQGQGGGA